MLPSRVSAPQLSNPTQEDIFASSLSNLFTDDTQNSHGTPGHSVIYTSPKHGDVILQIPQHPDVEEGRKLFAHYLWNAGVVAAEAIEIASSESGHNDSITRDSKVKWDKRYWNMRGKDVLELGAGTALPSLISALSGAHSVTITDHPSSPALITGTIAQNVLENLNINLLPSSALPASDTPSDTPHNPLPATTSSSPPAPRTPSSISIHGLTWGTPLFTSATHYGKPSSPQPDHHSFNKIIIADCLWMPSQHVNIVKTVNTYLRQAPASASASAPGEGGDEAVPCALVVAGFHTGRSIVARFFEIATGNPTGNGKPSFLAETEHANKASSMTSAERKSKQEVEAEDEKEDEEVKEVKGTLRAAEIFEIDVDCSVREWLPERLGESKEQTKRWCVCAVLMRR